ncbi:MAG: TetR/AcrR family transcriptional regulator [Actinomycetia bacterium]|nr:TetR/AcrR family transcriptional regulator [Actinomycetes bacterium]
MGARGHGAVLPLLPLVPQRVLGAATRLFAEQGFENTSVQQIVDAAGVTKGAMYHYFKSKDDLLVASYARLLDLQDAHLVAMAGRSASATDRLRMVVEDLVRTTLENLDDATVFYRSMHLLHEPSRGRVREQRREFRAGFERLVREGMSNGELRTDAPLDLISFNFFGAIGYLTVWYSPTGTRSIDEIAHWYADLLISALT